MYVIWNRAKGAFVAAGGGGMAFTRTLSRARVFETREAAHAEARSDEVVLAMVG